MEKEKKSIGVSKLLEESIENTCVCMTIEEKHQMREKIDKLDDIRRKEKYKEEDRRIKSIFDKLNEFSKFVCSGERKCFSDIQEELKDYQEFVRKEREKELYFEELDDFDREKLKEYISAKKEECRERSYRIEVRIIENHQE